ncbi:MAG: hypothetical protein RMM17_10815 [Acidobacteriota bacterium]|nr:hypothetical protein [Blastocatellia bacterium]MDW8413163.1 hypothetical protein [Acidobacteriota bacterium]
MQINELPLVAHKIHLLVQRPAGLGVCLNPDCNGPRDITLDILCAVTASVTDRCRYCDSIVLSIYLCETCGEWILVGKGHGEKYHQVGMCGEMRTGTLWILAIREYVLGTKLLVGGKVVNPR